MNLPDKVGSITWLPNLSILLAVALGIFVSEPPLATDRVMSGSEKSRTQSGEAVGLNYLWEDPYTPIADLDQAAIDGLPSLAKLIAKEDFVLFVGIEGSPRGGATENRTRTRHAISSAIAGRAEMMPERPAIADDRRSQLQKCRIQVGKTNYPVVCEFFKGLDLDTSRWFEVPVERVAVVYVDELRLQPTPFSLRWMVASARLDLSKPAGTGHELPFPSAASKAGPSSQEDTPGTPTIRGDFAYIGFCRSSHLEAFFSSPDIAKSLPQVHFGDIDLRLFSPFSTIENSILLDRITHGFEKDQPFRARFQRDYPSPVPNTWSNSLRLPPDGRGSDQFVIHLERIGADDGALCRGLVQELSQRGIVVPPRETTWPEPEPEPEDAILLLADMDNLHSKMLVESFRKAALAGKPGWNGSYDAEDLEGRIRVVHYPEALDGLKPGLESSGSGQAAHGATGLPASIRPVNIHPAEGSSQYDALRRLPERLRQLERDEQVRYRAIGFFGSDPHDKILLMRALRNSFSETLFFTNDLDALFWQGRDRSCAQNLVVSTAFGLSLDGTFQGSIPPFRSSVQTSTYLAAIRALRFDRKGPAAKSLVWPQREAELYEIGRKGPHLLAYWKDPFQRIGGASAGRVPVAGPRPIERGVQLLVIAFASLVLVACVWYSTRFSRRIQKGRRFRWLPPASIAVIVVAAGICIAYGWHVPAPELLAAGEPRVWLSGISGIPVIIGNTLTVALATILLLLALRRLALNMQEVKLTYPLGGPDSGDRREDKTATTYKSSGRLRTPSPWDITGRFSFLGICKKLRHPKIPRPIVKAIRLTCGGIARIVPHRRSQRQRITRFLERTPESRLTDSFAREGIASSNSNRLLRVVLGLGFLALVHHLASGGKSPNTLPPPYLRGEIEREVFKWTDIAAKSCLVFTCCFVIDTQLRLGLSLAKFGRLINYRGTRNSSPYPHRHRMDLPDDLLPPPGIARKGWHPPLQPPELARDIGLWELPLVEIAASRFRASAPAVGIPFTLLFILLVTRYSVFEGVSYPAGEMIFFVTAMSLPLVTGAFAQFQMRSIFVAASARLRRAKAIHTGKIEAFCGNEIDSLAKLRADTIYLPTENPLLRAILLPLGGVGILELANGVAPYLK